MFFFTQTEHPFSLWRLNISFCRNFWTKIIQTRWNNENKTGNKYSFDSYLLRLPLLIECEAYFDGVGLILRCWNDNEESGVCFSLFPLFQAKHPFEGKNWRNCPSLAAYKTWLNRCETVILGSFWFLRTEDYFQKGNWNFAHSALWEMHIEFQKPVFWKTIGKASYFLIIVTAVWYDVCHWNSVHLFSGSSLLSWINQYKPFVNLKCLKPSQIHTNKFEVLWTEMNFVCTNVYKFVTINLPSASWIQWKRIHYFEFIIMKSQILNVHKVFSWFGGTVCQTTEILHRLHTFLSKQLECDIIRKMRFQVFYW